MGSTQNGTANKRKPRTAALGLLGALAVLVFAACSPAEAGPTDPVSLKPSAATVMEMSDEFTFEFMPGETIDDIEWDIEIEYNTRDVQAVFDFYDAELRALGFNQVDIELDDDDEVEAEYRNTNTGVWVELEVERDDGRVDVDMDIEDPRSYASGDLVPPFSMTEFLDWDVPIYPDASIRDVEWDFNFDHPNTDAQAVFNYYDELLQDLGWTQTDIDNDDDDEWEADYRQDGVHIELEVEEDNGGAEVELELNKLRFYQGQN